MSQLRTTYAGVTQTVLSQLTWNPSGQLTKLRFGNALVEHRSYDLAGQLTQLNRVGIGKLDYAYDLAGNITQIGTERYSYDSLDRLLQAQGIAPRRYTYDANGNRTASDGSPYVLAVDSNRLLQGSARVYDYDAAGNPLSDGRYSYTYDSLGRLTEVRQGVTVRQRNTYNALGQRVRKETAGGSETSTVTHYLYSTDGQLLAELDSSGNTLREYLYLQSWPIAVVDYAAPPVAAVAVVEGADSIEESVEVADAAPKDAETRADLPVVAVPGATLTYLHPDHLGTPRLATDSSKRVIWRWDSAPFGDSAAQEDPDGDGVPFTLNLRFPGQYYDAETGLHYNYYRDYDPATGRYLESDPIGLRGGVGTYGYANQNPARWSDLLGLHKGDKWYGRNDREFQRWFHQCWKQKGNADADQGEIEEAFAEWVSRGKPTGGKCGNPPQPPLPVPTESCDGTCPKTATFIAVGGATYVIYRCLRMALSAPPPLWPTIPTNMAVP